MDVDEAPELNTVPWVLLSLSAITEDGRNPNVLYAVHEKETCNIKDISLKMSASIF